MSHIKKLLHAGFSLFLIWQTFLLLENLSFNRSLSFSQSLLNAILLNLFVTGIFTIVYSFPVYKLLPDNYYRINNPERLKSFCNLIKIEHFKKILKNQIKAHNLEAYKIDYVILNFVNIDDEIYNYYGRQCKKIEVELELKLESGKVFKTNDVLYADSHSALREYKRAN